MLFKSRYLLYNYSGDSMRISDNRGFTLVELIATIVVLVLVMGIGAFAVSALIKSAKEKDLELLIKNIKDGTETYYLECKYSKSEVLQCPAATINGGLTYYEVSLKELITYGFLEGNGKKGDDTYQLVNPVDKSDISSCRVKYTYSSGGLSFYDVGSNKKNCPKLGA